MNVSYVVPRVGGTSPWGKIQTAERIDVMHTIESDGAGEAVTFDIPLTVVSTASHGGIYVPSCLLGHIPTAYRQYAKAWSGSENWYEEDCAVLAVVVSFPEAFPRTDAEKLHRLRQTIDGLAVKDTTNRTVGGN